MDDGSVIQVGGESDNIFVTARVESSNNKKIIDVLCPDSCLSCNYFSRNPGKCKLLVYNYSPEIIKYLRYKNKEKALKRL
jgi:hypothetical protein